MGNRSTMATWSDDQVLAEAKRGDPDALMFFCERNLPSLLRRVKYDCSHIGFPEFRAEDACHDAIIRAVRFCQRHSGKKLPDISIAWVRQIALNLMKDEMEREGRSYGLDHADYLEPTYEDNSTDDLDELGHVLDFFDWLKPDDRDVIEYVLLQGMTFEKTGEQLKISGDAASKRFYRAMERLRELIAQHSTVSV